MDDNAIDTETALECIGNLIEHFDELGFNEYHRLALLKAYDTIEKEAGNGVKD